MASYTPRNTLGKKNGMANSDRPQTKAQRDGFSGSQGGTMGAYRGESGIFNMTLRGTDEDINNTAFNSMLDLYENGAYTASDEFLNPDFPTAESIGKELGYNLHPDGSIDEGITDAPSDLGPNIKTFSIDDSGSPVIPENTQNVKSVHSSNSGFGTTIDRNYIKNTTVGSYLLRRHGDPGNNTALNLKPSPTLGEYVDEADLNYSDLPIDTGSSD